ncbi:histone-lysine N-methyltransferase set-18-like isoform X4 [Paramacrobiotus metropolitanus]|uniref:histone-lysine N-methyltransferase set-18-like isoform X4 n=1 Tax=Paramacrobiotus metropolitanus TaxID=2943436 RepID=UPI0024457911|nr:histone-lysine N-methyltransferase set-18-like isoform X4 [Paramacrobiotus metropolitanus]
MSARKAVLRTVSAGPDKEDSAVDLTFPVQSVETKMHGPYKRGDRLLYEKPWIFVVSEKCRERICNHCFESLHSSTGASLPCQPEILVRVSRTMKPGLRRCTGCAFSWYCGKDCQKTSWKFVHKHECQFFKKALETEETAIPLTVETVRLCLQAMIRMKNDPDWDRPADGFPELSHRTFPNIMSHWKEIREDQKELDFIDLMSSYFQKIWKGQDLYSDLIEPSVLGVIYGKVRINNMTIFGTYGDKLGVGLYLSASAIDHACLPNACPSFSGIRINIHATEDVDCFDNVRLSYLDQTYFSRPRREMLRQRYYFDCFCRGCADDRLDRKMNAVRCTKPSCKGHVLMDPYTFDSDPCSVCQEMPDDISKESIKRALQNGIEAQALVAEAKKSDGKSHCLASLASKSTARIGRTVFNFAQSDASNQHAADFHIPSSRHLRRHSRTIRQGLFPFYAAGHCVSPSVFPVVLSIFRDSDEVYNTRTARAAVTIAASQSACPFY